MAPTPQFIAENAFFFELLLPEPAQIRNARKASSEHRKPGAEARLAKASMSTG